MEGVLQYDIIYQPLEEVHMLAAGKRKNSKQLR